jgi:aldose 1-epimerase
VNVFESEGAELAFETAVTLAAGNLRLELNPSVGGSIFAFEWVEDDCARAILRECNSRSENVLDADCFPLVPFVNRIRGGRFVFRGREVPLAPNMAGDPSSLHGQGWLNPWQVDRENGTDAVLSYRHRVGEWPWDYEARQEFALDDRGLALTLACRNVTDSAMPCGLGLHPYFPCGPGTRIDTQVTHVWTIDQNVLPVERVPAEGRFDLHDRLVCGQDLDHGFGGWGGIATMTDPDWPFDLHLSSPTANFFQLYSPEEGGIFVAEPVSHANAALNAPEAAWPELGMRVLEPGEEMSIAMRLDVVPKSRPSG